jgi:NAD(P)-dependent dehydrogenase (short-subunit alcohol dehydrogenase family)
MDITSSSSVAMAFTAAVETFGRVDYVCHSAGIGVERPAPVQEAQEDEWRRFLEVNVTGALLVVREAGKIMREGGSIIVMGSANSVMATPAIVQYVAAKHAVLGVVRSAGEFSLPRSFLSVRMSAWSQTCESKGKGS